MWPTIRWKNIPRLLFPHPLTLLDMISKVRVVDDYRDHCHGGDNDLNLIPDICHFFTQAKFLENRIYMEIYTVNCQFIQ